MTSVDADLRSGSRLETGRRSESIIYNTFIFIYYMNKIPGSNKM
jgi:hypothetical protein